jgi:G3E family GTPase
MKTLPLDDSHARLPIHIITGFLGSGKTTLLNQLLIQDYLKDTAVIVNEFGEVGVDHLLVNATTEDIMMLEGGCLCCTVRTDLVNTLEGLFHKRKAGTIPTFNQVLVETSGLADPAPILRTLINDVFIIKHYRLGIVMTTVDAFYGEQQLAEYDESVKQAALANQLILTKVDLVEATSLATLKNRLCHLNPTATMHAINLTQDKLTVDFLFQTQDYDQQGQPLNTAHWLQAATYLAHESSKVKYQQPIVAAHTHRPDAYIRAFCIEYTAPLHWLTLERWIRVLTRLRGKDILRIKGIAYTYETDLPVIIQGVQHILQPPTTLAAWPDEKRLSQIVFITRNLDKSIVEQLLHRLSASKTPLDVCDAALLLLGQPASH